MNKDSICRFCKHYQPDERYFGVVGWCKVNDKPSGYDQTCKNMEEGKQYWLCGKEVRE